MRIKKFKVVLGFFSFTILIGLIVATFYYNKPAVDVKDSEAMYFLTAQDLIDEFLEDEMGTSRKYSENIIQVKGKIYNISSNKGNSIITLKDPNAESSVICHMLPGENKRILQFKKGQSIYIKGICTGYLLDVIMVRCTLDD
ncbi:OB-fold putative lipoprotein [Flavobacteriaceae bacterium F89]|uniref:OB-fold putative lipoprotein n=1 Tax=Cerina litoralis TaxID=2874477 RepID=A0AAE3EYU4_9FLAO|nr:hypothetical protein [Cerina litoralis]MCG2462859.1 OB-fold putative lipoprotein [Cerina litoralis]